MTNSNQTAGKSRNSDALTRRLRGAKNYPNDYGVLWNLCDEAADEIDRLCLDAIINGAVIDGLTKRNVRLTGAMKDALAVMRASGWHLAAAYEGDDPHAEECTAIVERFEVALNINPEDHTKEPYE